jgi:hypothetical protein
MLMRVKKMPRHKRKRPKKRRAGCLLCKPHKGNGLSPESASLAGPGKQEVRARDSEKEQLAEEPVRRRSTIWELAEAEWYRQCVELAAEHDHLSVEFLFWWSLRTEFREVNAKRWARDPEKALQCWLEYLLYKLEWAERKEHHGQHYE